MKKERECIDIEGDRYLILDDECVEPPAEQLKAFAERARLLDQAAIASSKRAKELAEESSRLLDIASEQRRQRDAAITILGHLARGARVARSTRDMPLVEREG